jgi:hypothetical protein
MVDDVGIEGLSPAIPHTGTVSSLKIISSSPSASIIDDSASCAGNLLSTEANAIGLVVVTNNITTITATNDNMFLIIFNLYDFSLTKLILILDSTKILSVNFSKSV